MANCPSRFARSGPGQRAASATIPRQNGRPTARGLPLRTSRVTLRRAPLSARRLATSALVALLAASALGPSLALAAPPSASPSAPPAASGGPKPGDVIPGRLLVRFDRAATAADKGKARGLVGGAKIRESKLVKGLEAVSTNLATETALRKLRGAKGVLYAEPDRYIGVD